MLMRWKSREIKSTSSVSMADSSVGPSSYTEDMPPVKVAIHKITASDFQTYYGSLERLQEVAQPLTMVISHPAATLDSIRPTVFRSVQETSSSCVEGDSIPAEQPLSEKWVFLHRANDRLYPISSDMETQLCVGDMLSTGIFVLNTSLVTSNNSDCSDCRTTNSDASETALISEHLRVSTQDQARPGFSACVDEPAMSQNYVECNDDPS